MNMWRRVLVGVAVTTVLGVVLLVPFLFALAEPEEEAMVMHCVDKRYSKVEHITVLPEGYHFCAVGCAKDFLESELTREEFYHDLDELKKAGVNVEKVFVVDHCPCKAYQNDDSLIAHAENLRRVARVMHQDPRSKNLKLDLSIHDMKAHKRIPVKE